MSRLRRTASAPSLLVRSLHALPAVGPDDARHDDGAGAKPAADATAGAPVAAHSEAQHKLALRVCIRQDVSDMRTFSRRFRVRAAPAAPATDQPRRKTRARTRLHDVLAPSLPATTSATVRGLLASLGTLAKRNMISEAHAAKLAKNLQSGDMVVLRQAVMRCKALESRLTLANVEVELSRRSVASTPQQKQRSRSRNHSRDARGGCEQPGGAEVAMLPPPAAAAAAPAAPPASGSAIVKDGTHSSSAAHSDASPALAPLTAAAAAAAGGRTSTPKCSPLRPSVQQPSPLREGFTSGLACRLEFGDDAPEDAGQPRAKQRPQPAAAHARQRQPRAHNGPPAPRAAPVLTSPEGVRAIADEGVLRVPVSPVQVPRAAGYDADAAHADDEAESSSRDEQPEDAASGTASDARPSLEVPVRGSAVLVATPMRPRRPEPGSVTPKRLPGSTHKPRWARGHLTPAPSVLQGGTLPREIVCTLPLDYSTAPLPIEALDSAPGSPVAGMPASAMGGTTVPAELLFDAGRARRLRGRSLVDDMVAGRPRGRTQSDESTSGPLKQQQQLQQQQQQQLQAGPRGGAGAGAPTARATRATRAHSGGASDAEATVARGRCASDGTGVEPARSARD